MKRMGYHQEEKYALRAKNRSETKRQRFPVIHDDRFKEKRGENRKQVIPVQENLTR